MEQNIDPDLLKQILALRESGIGPMGRPESTTPGYGYMSRSGAQGTALNDYTLTGFAGSRLQGDSDVYDPAGNREYIYGKTDGGSWGVQRTPVWDTSGKFLGYSVGDGNNLGLAKFAATAVGGYYGMDALNGMTGAGAAGLEAGGGADLAGGLIEGAGGVESATPIADSFATGGGYLGEGVPMTGGSTLTAGGETVLGSTLGDASLLTPTANPYDDPTRALDTVKNNGGTPDVTKTTTTSSGGTNTVTPNSNNPITARDVRDIAQVGTQVIKGIDTITGGGGGGGGGNSGGGGDVDQRLIDAQLRSMDTQELLMRQMISNANEVMPFQRQAMQFGLDTAREAYGDYRSDRQYALGRRDQLTGLQNRAIAEANTFNTEAKREELAGMAMSDIGRAYSGAANQAARNLSRMGVNPNDGRWGSQVKQLMNDQALATAQVGNQARRDARTEGRYLNDRAAQLVASAPNLAMQSTGAGQGAGGSGVGLAGNSIQAMNSGLSTAGNLAGNWGNNATNMANVQSRTGSSGNDWSGWGALLGAGVKLYDMWGK